MPIVTDFAFQHDRSRLSTLFVPQDFLGPLRAFVGGAVGARAVRTWKGAGFNLIWRPNVPGEAGPDKFFLQLNLTQEELAFNDISGLTGVANRGFFQKATFLGALAYLQTIKDSFDGSDQHFEPGVWGNVFATTDPFEPASVFRMGSIPHGTAVNLQGRVLIINGPPQFDRSSISPFRIGATDDGVTDVAHFLDFFALLDKESPSRTPNAQVPGLTQAQLFNPNLFLSEAIFGQTITKTTIIQIASDTRLITQGNSLPGVPDVGGGTTNIAFLVGQPPDDGKGTGRPNANAPTVTATFWIEEGAQSDGAPLLQLQYTQRVLLNFNGLSWPHITVATLTPF